MWNTTVSNFNLILSFLISYIISLCEIYFNGQQLSYEVVFDDQDNIKRIHQIQNNPDVVKE